MTPSMTPREILESKLSKKKAQKLIDEINDGINGRLNLEDHINKKLDKFKIPDPKLSEEIARKVQPIP